MVSDQDNSPGKDSSDTLSRQSPEMLETHQASGWTAFRPLEGARIALRPIPIGTSSRTISHLDLNGLDFTPTESATRSSLNREPSTLPKLTYGTVSEPPQNSLDTLTAAAVMVAAADSAQMPPAPTRPAREAFAHAHPDPASLPHPWLLSAAQASPTAATSQSARNIADAIADLEEDDDDRSEVFPHNFNYEHINTFELLQAAFDPFNPQVTVHPADLDDIDGQHDVEKITNMLQALKEAATIGYFAAAKIDNKSGKGNEIKLQNRNWNLEWDKIITEQELPLMKGAVTVGYRVAKRAELAQAGELEKFFVCERGIDTVSGCTQNQYRRDAHRSGISDYFGRNKKATKFMSGLPNWCRKDYQNQSYMDVSWQRQKRRIILATIDNIEKQAQKDGKYGVTFEIKLRNWDEKRIIEVATGKGEGAAPKNNKRPADIDVLQHIHKEFCGTNKSVDDAKELVQWAYDNYEEKLAEFCKDKTEKEVKKQIKDTGPKYAEFQLLPEWDRLYTKGELARAGGEDISDEDENNDGESSPRTPSTSKTNRMSTPRTKTPKRARKGRESEEEYKDGSPLKKQKS